MRRTLLALFLALAACGTAAQEPDPPAFEAPAASSTTMTQYYMVFLRRGPAWTSARPPETTKVSQGHMANIARLQAEGKLVVAGPLDDVNGGANRLTGLFVFRTASAEETKELVETDPAVAAGRFVYEIMPWYAPSSLAVGP